VIADLAPPRQLSWSEHEQDHLADAASLWAVLNALENVVSEGDDALVARGARTSFTAHLHSLNLTSADLFEHVAAALERDDWDALGLTKPRE